MRNSYEKTQELAQFSQICGAPAPPVTPFQYRNNYRYNPRVAVLYVCDSYGVCMIVEMENDNIVLDVAVDPFGFEISEIEKVDSVDLEKWREVRSLVDEVAEMSDEDALDAILASTDIDKLSDQFDSFMKESSQINHEISSFEATVYAINLHEYSDPVVASLHSEIDNGENSYIPNLTNSTAVRNVEKWQIN